MKTLVQLISIGISIILTGCVTLYKPNIVHSPMLKEKGELTTSASLGISGSGLMNLQAAYATSNNTGIMINGMYHNRNLKSADSSVNRLNIFFGEAGAGYFNTLGSEKNFLFQCYGGGGYGHSNDKITNTNQPYPEVRANYLNLFIQPGLAFTDKNLDVAFDLRANYVHLFNIYANLYEQFDFWNTNYKYYSNATLNFINLEPAITIRAGGEKLKGVLQMGAIIPTFNPKSYIAVNTSSYLLLPLLKLSIGFNYTFNWK